MSGGSRGLELSPGNDEGSAAPRVIRPLVERGLLDHFAFLEDHRARIRSTSPLERLSRGTRHRTALVGSFPDRAPVVRLVGMILAEHDDEWQDGRRHVRPEMMRTIAALVAPGEVGQPLLLASGSIRREEDALPHPLLGRDPPTEPTR